MHRFHESRTQCMSCKCKQNLNLPGELWLITVVPGSLSIQFMRLLLKSRVAPKLPTWIPTSYILSAYPVYLGESLFFPSTQILTSKFKHLLITPHAKRQRSTKFTILHEPYLVRDLSEDDSSYQCFYSSRII